MRPKCPDCGRTLEPHCVGFDCGLWVCSRCQRFGNEHNWIEWIDYGSKHGS